MPELAEVEFFRKRWHLAAAGERVVRVLGHPQKKLLRHLDFTSFRRALVGAKFECRRVCRQALVVIAGRGRKLPKDLNAGIPRTWLFKHRWRRGARCPLTGKPLVRATIGGRTTCWSPARQKLK